MAHGTDQEAGAHGVAPQSEPLRSRRPALVASALALATVVLVVSSGNSGGVGLGLQQSLWGWAAPVKPSLPAEFDVRWGNGNCRGFSPLSIANAGKCNAGHALLLSAMLSARACMSSRAFDIRLAPQSILDCYPGGEGCLKPSFETALKMLATQDIPDEQCHPLAPFEPEGYVASPDNCATDMCHGALRYAVKPASILHAVATFPATAGKVDPTADAWVLHYNEEPALPTSVEALMAMVHAGPVVGTVNVYYTSEKAIRLGPNEDPISPFTNLRKPVFTGPGKVADLDRPDARHAVMVLGWGESGGGKYWLVQDTIGRCFGDQGVFRVLMGANVLNLEAYGFYSADLDLNKALGDTAIADFASACAPEVEAHGACQNAGVLSPNGCACVCAGGWVGRQCDVCAIRCHNGGIVQNYELQGGAARESKCRCDCPDGFEGDTCETACPAASRIILPV